MPKKPAELKGRLPMFKTLIVAVLTAFTLALVGETAITAVALANGTWAFSGDTIELGVSWVVVLVTFYAAVIKTAWRRW